MKPLVSIITPSYNQGKFIRETIESVLSQDYDNIEYIVIDGMSSDNSLEIIREYDGRLVYVSEKDKGQSDAINKGFRMAHGEIVAWLNSDDVYEPHCISRAVEEFEKNGRLGLVYGDGYITDADSNKVKVFEYTQEFDFWKLVNFWDYIMQPATFFKRAVLEQVGYLDVDLHYCMDWDLWIKLASVSEVKYINELLACSREYGDTKTSTGGDKRLTEIISLLQKYSKKTNPLGVQSYKASTFYAKHKDDIWPIRGFAGWYLQRKHKQLEKQFPQKYADGWMGKTYSMIVPDYVSMVKVKFQMPLQVKKTQELDIFINGEKVDSIIFDNIGEKDCSINVNNCSGLVEVNFVAKRTFSPGNGDNRKLSLQIAQIELI